MARVTDPTLRQKIAARGLNPDDERLAKALLMGGIPIGPQDEGVRSAFGSGLSRGAYNTVAGMANLPSLLTGGMVPEAMTPRDPTYSETQHPIASGLGQALPMFGSFFLGDKGISKALSVAGKAAGAGKVGSALTAIAKAEPIAKAGAKGLTALVPEGGVGTLAALGARNLATGATVGALTTPGTAEERAQAAFHLGVLGTAMNAYGPMAGLSRTANVARGVLGGAAASTVTAPMAESPEADVALNIGFGAFFGAMTKAQRPSKATTQVNTARPTEAGAMPTPVVNTPEIAKRVAKTEPVHIPVEPAVPESGTTPSVEEAAAPKQRVGRRVKVEKKEKTVTKEDGTVLKGTVYEAQKYSEDGTPVGDPQYFASGKEARQYAAKENRQAALNEQKLAAVAEIEGKRREAAARTAPTVKRPLGKTPKKVLERRREAITRMLEWEEARTRQSLEMEAEQRRQAQEQRKGQTKEYVEERLKNEVFAPLRESMTVEDWSAFMDGSFKDQESFIAWSEDGLREAEAQLQVLQESGAPPEQIQMAQADVQVKQARLDLAVSGSPELFNAVREAFKNDPATLQKFGPPNKRILRERLSGNPEIDARNALAWHLQSQGRPNASKAMPIDPYFVAWANRIMALDKNKVIVRRWQAGGLNEFDPFMPTEPNLTVKGRLKVRGQVKSEREFSNTLQRLKAEAQLGPKQATPSGIDQVIAELGGPDYLLKVADWAKRQSRRKKFQLTARELQKYDPKLTIRQANAVYESLNYMGVVDDVNLEGLIDTTVKAKRRKVAKAQAAPEQTEVAGPTEVLLDMIESDLNAAVSKANRPDELTAAGKSAARVRRMMGLIDALRTSEAERSSQQRMLVRVFTEKLRNRVESSPVDPTRSEDVLATNELVEFLTAVESKANPDADVAEIRANIADELNEAIDRGGVGNDEVDGLFQTREVIRDIYAERLRGEAGLMTDATAMSAQESAGVFADVLGSREFKLSEIEDAPKQLVAKRIERKAMDIEGLYTKAVDFVARVGNADARGLAKYLEVPYSVGQKFIRRMQGEGLLGEANRRTGEALPKRVPKKIAEEQIREVAAFIQGKESVTVAELQAQFGVTAKMGKALLKEMERRGAVGKYAKGGRKVKKEFVYLPETPTAEPAQKYPPAEVARRAEAAGARASFEAETPQPNPPAPGVMGGEPNEALAGMGAPRVRVPGEPVMPWAWYNEIGFAMDNELPPPRFEQKQKRDKPYRVPVEGAGGLEAQAKKAAKGATPEVQQVLRERAGSKVSVKATTSLDALDRNTARPSAEPVVEKTKRQIPLAEKTLDPSVTAGGKFPKDPAARMRIWKMIGIGEGRDLTMSVEDITNVLRERTAKSVESGRAFYHKVKARLKDLEADYPDDGTFHGAGIDEARAKLKEAIRRAEADHPDWVAKVGPKKRKPVWRSESEEMDPGRIIHNALPSIERKIKRLLENNTKSLAALEVARAAGKGRGAKTIAKLYTQAKNNADQLNGLLKARDTLMQRLRTTELTAESELVRQREEALSHEEDFRQAIKDNEFEKVMAEEVGDLRRWALAHMGDPDVPMGALKYLTRDELLAHLDGIMATGSGVALANKIRVLRKVLASPAIVGEMRQIQKRVVRKMQNEKWRDQYAVDKEAYDNAIGRGEDVRKPVSVDKRKQAAVDAQDPYFFRRMLASTKSVHLGNLRELTAILEYGDRRLHGEEPRFGIKLARQDDGRMMYELMDTVTGETTVHEEPFSMAERMDSLRKESLQGPDLHPVGLDQLFEDPAIYPAYKRRIKESVYKPPIKNVDNAVFGGYWRVFRTWLDRAPSVGKMIDAATGNRTSFGPLLEQTRQAVNRATRSAQTWSERLAGIMREAGFAANDIDDNMYLRNIMYQRSAAIREMQEQFENSLAVVNPDLTPTELRQKSLEYVKGWTDRETVRIVNNEANGDPDRALRMQKFILQFDDLMAQYFKERGWKDTSIAEVAAYFPMIANAANRIRDIDASKPFQIGDLVRAWDNTSYELARHKGMELAPNPVREQMLSAVGLWDKETGAGHLFRDIDSYFRSNERMKELRPLVSELQRQGLDNAGALGDTGQKWLTDVVRVAMGMPALGETATIQHTQMRASKVAQAVLKHMQEPDTMKIPIPAGVQKRIVKWAKQQGYDAADGRVQSLLDTVGGLWTKQVFAGNPVTALRDYFGTDTTVVLPALGTKTYFESTRAMTDGARRKWLLEKGIEWAVIDPDHDMSMAAQMQAQSDRSRMSLTKALVGSDRVDKVNYYAGLPYQKNDLWTRMKLLDGSIRNAERGIAAYKESGLFADFIAESGLDQFQFGTDTRTLNELKAMIDRGNVDGATRQVAEIYQVSAAIDYSRFNAPRFMWNRVGRFLGKFGTWPVNMTNTFISRLMAPYRLSQVAPPEWGYTKGRAYQQTVARNAAAGAGASLLLGVGYALNVDTTDWVMGPTTLMWAGGPGMSNVMTTQQFLTGDPMLWKELENKGMMRGALKMARKYVPVPGSAAVRGLAGQLLPEDEIFAREFFGASNIKPEADLRIGALLGLRAWDDERPRRENLPRRLIGAAF